MAESMVHAVQPQPGGKAKAKSSATKMPTEHPTEKETKSAKDPEVRKVPTPLSLSSKSDASRGTPATPTPAFQKEMLSILTEIRSNQKVQESKLIAMETRMNSLEEGYEENYDYDDSVYEVEEDVMSHMSQSETAIQPRDSNNNESAFKDLETKYNVQEKLDMEVDDYLAKITNSAFKNGLPDEDFKSYVARIGRPANCDGLTKTRVNNVIWNLLSPQMHSADDKMQSIQDGVLKAATVIVKLLNVASDRLCREELESGTEAINLLGHANKLINNRRKSMHKKELNSEYHHLCSQSRGYTDLLYGDDVGRDVKEIQDINRIGSKIRSQYHSLPYPRGRGGRMYHRVSRGRVAKPRGRGRGYQRPKNPPGVFNSMK